MNINNIIFKYVLILFFPNPSLTLFTYFPTANLHQQSNNNTSTKHQGKTPQIQILKLMKCWFGFGSPEIDGFSLDFISQLLFRIEALFSTIYNEIPRSTHSDSTKLEIESSNTK